MNQSSRSPLLEERKKMTSAETVSIIIPTGGRVDPLTGCLASIQRYAPKGQIIVIGDKNDERTQRALLKNFPFVRYLESEESSAVVKRNLGIAHATNDILIFVDDDVIVDRSWLENLLRHYSDDLVGGVGGRVEGPWLRGGTLKYNAGGIGNGFFIGHLEPTVTR